MRWARSAWAFIALAASFGVASCALFVDFDQSPASGGAGAAGGGDAGGGSTSTGAGGMGASGAGGMGGAPDCGEWCRGTLCESPDDCDGDACTNGVCQATHVAQSSDGPIGVLGADDGTVAFVTLGLTTARNDGHLCMVQLGSQAQLAECRADNSGPGCKCAQAASRWDEFGTHVAVHGGKAYYSPQCSMSGDCDPQSTTTPVLVCQDDVCTTFPGALPNAVLTVNGLTAFDGRLVAANDDNNGVVSAELSGGGAFVPTTSITTGQKADIDLHSLAFSGPSPNDPAYATGFGDPHAACIAATTAGQLVNGSGAAGCAATTGHLLNVVSAGPGMGLGVARFDPGTNRTNFVHIPDPSQIGANTKDIVPSLSGQLSLLAARGGFYYAWQAGALQRCPAKTPGQGCQPVTQGGLQPGPIVATGRYVFVASGPSLYRARR